MSKDVPSVTTAIAMLRHLQRAGGPASLTAIARAVGANGSTCFNILQVLLREQLVVRDDASKRYRLGPALLDLGLTVARESDARTVALPYLQRLVREVHLGAVIVERAADEHFVVTESVESPRDVRVSVALGTRFPPNVPGFARAYLAWQADDEVDRFLGRWGAPRYTAQADGDDDSFRRHLATVRERGFAASLGEYDARYHALAAPIFDRRGGPTFLIGLIGFAAELDAPRLAEHGRRLADTAAEISAALGGQTPLFAPIHPTQEHV